MFHANGLNYHDTKKYIAGLALAFIDQSQKLVESNKFLDMVQRHTTARQFVQIHDLKNKNLIILKTDSFLKISEVITSSH